jgi:hypothetical protein
VIDIRNVALDVPVYQLERGSVQKVRSNIHSLLFPGTAADSFVDTPDRTSVEGGFAAALAGSPAIWSDDFDSGPQDEFLFARLTVGETGHFSGTVSVAGPNWRVELPFNFVLPGTAEDLALIDGEPKFTLELDASAPALTGSGLTQIPEPSSLILAALMGIFWSSIRAETHGYVAARRRT